MASRSSRSGSTTGTCERRSRSGTLLCYAVAALAKKKKSNDGGAKTTTGETPAASGAPPAVDGPAQSSAAPSSSTPTEPPNLLLAALRIWFAAYRIEVLLFAVAFVVLAGFSGQRFLRQSAAPHFVYQAKAFLEGHIDLDPMVLPNIEDWACVREVNGQKTRCEGQPLRTDKWYVSFPPFPAVVMMPFVAINSYQLNDTSFGVIVGALAVALFYALLRWLSKNNESTRTDSDNTVIALLLAFGTLFFYCAIRGEVWFSAEVMGVALTCLYARNAVRAHRPLLAGLFWSMATLTRTPLLFTGIFFVLEALAPNAGNRIDQLKASLKDKVALRKLALFAAGAAPLGLLAAIFNYVRFGKLTEFGHAFLFNNRVNSDIDTYGLFHPTYLARNLKAAFFLLPDLKFNPFRLGYDPHGLSLLLTLPLLALLFVPKEKPRIMWPLVVTVLVTALPGLLYQNDGYMQFGFRFSLDYTPYLLLLFAVGAWSLRNRWVIGLALLGVVVNFWGAAAFRGYTEYVRNW